MIIKVNKRYGITHKFYFTRGMNELVEMNQDNTVFRNELVKLSDI